MLIRLTILTLILGVLEYRVIGTLQMISFKYVEIAIKSPINSTIPQFFLRVFLRQDKHVSQKFLRAVSGIGDIPS